MSNVAPHPPLPGPVPAPQPSLPGLGPAAQPVAELAELDGLADRPLAEHVAVFDALHRALTDQLSSVET